MIKGHIFIDIETIESDRESILAYIASIISPPGTYKKADSIAKWDVEERPGATAKAIADTAFDGGCGRLAAVSLAIGDGPVLSATSVKQATDDAPAAYDVATEKKIILRLFAACERVYAELGRPPTIVGHNVLGFDIRWIWKRALVLGIRPPSWWPVDAKPWQPERVFDTMTYWEGVGGRISQDRLCLALDLPLKGEFDGSMVGAAWKAGEFEKIRSYNARDVETVRSIWKKLTLYAEPEQSAADDLPPLLIPAAAEAFISGASA
ncbi:hypothetical protein [Aureimonas glaciei]|uniref:Predicted 3'-5' exonuclease PolB-like domain-containing protein n=1 Tax=Aureimonas glaciei TaxID=1776957 RepID=A0A917DKE8_9HYPH|nr:hypothetical protein [Aureimonas glaciei]GGD43894.1 hypothetical protein GCM10011335_53150 [Aureimonas glaciei]